MSKPQLTNSWKCQVCKHEHNAQTSVEGDYTAHPGDFSICIGCGTIYVLDENLNGRFATEDEWRDLGNEARQQLDKAQRLINRRNGKKALDFLIEANLNSKSGIGDVPEDFVERHMKQIEELKKHLPS